MDQFPCNISEIGGLREMEDNLHFENGTLRLELPTPEIVDYAEIFVLAILVGLGFPLNVYSCIRMFRRSNRRASAHQTPNLNRGRERIPPRRTTSRALTLELHLTWADLLVICLYGTSQIAWLSTYSWTGGDLLCRLMKFCHTFCFYATSNIVSVIAIDRVHVSWSIDRPNGHRNRCTACPYLNVALATAWTLAFVCSVPQLLVWRVYTPYACEYPNWAQCVTVWMVRPLSEDDQAELSLERLYTSMHVVFVFWAPLLIILFSYSLIVFRFREKIQVNLHDARRHQRAVNALTFKKRASSFHKRYLRDSEAGSAMPMDSVDTVELSQCESSAGRLAAVPIVLNCSQAFICQPIMANRAVKTLSRAQNRTVRTAFRIVLAYLLCWSPYNALVLWRYFDPTFESRFLEFSSNFIILNAVLNPLIYNMN